MIGSIRLTVRLVRAGTAASSAARAAQQSCYSTRPGYKYFKNRESFFGGPSRQSSQRQQSQQQAPGQRAWQDTSGHTTMPKLGQGFGDLKYGRLQVWGAGLAIFAFTYYTTHLEEVPLTGRRRFLAVSEREEIRMGEYSKWMITQQFARKLLPPNHPTYRMVQDIARPIIAVSGLDHLDWEIYVIDDDTANAFVLPGGKIFVFTGILPVAKTREGLATVLGHEIGHVVARHTAEKMSFAKVFTLIELTIALFFGAPMWLQQQIANTMFELPFSRRTETEADYIGLVLMSKACFPPDQAVGLWQRMQEVQKGKEPPEFLSTHPSHEHRARTIQGWLPEARNVYNDAGCGQVNHMFSSADMPMPRLM
eukprot:Clim_evm214s157 gene=Clim_evmTU214s157